MRPAIHPPPVRPATSGLHSRLGRPLASTRSGWRRGLSLVWNGSLAWRQRNAPVLRLELHPQDADHPSVLRCWSRMLATALRTRQPLLLKQAAELVQPMAALRAQDPRVRGR